MKNNYSNQEKNYLKTNLSSTTSFFSSCVKVQFISFPKSIGVQILCPACNVLCPACNVFCRRFPPCAIRYSNDPWSIAINLLNIHGRTWMDEILHRTPQHIDLKIEYPKIHRLQFVLVYMISYIQLSSSSRIFPIKIAMYPHLSIFCPSIWCKFQFVQVPNPNLSPYSWLHALKSHMAPWLWHGKVATETKALGLWPGQPWP